MNTQTDKSLQEKIRDAITPDVKRTSSYELAILHGLQFKKTYQGTVTQATIDKRRRDNRVARQSRRTNRRA